jgi:hypothetical protein
VGRLDLDLAWGQEKLGQGGLGEDDAKEETEKKPN